MFLWIGLTGGIATGKSTVAQLLRSQGFDVVDADQLAREVVLKGTPAHKEIVAAFGAGVVAPDGELNRRKIGELVFSDKAKLTVLEGIIHPRVRDLALLKRGELAAKGKALAFYDVPLLFEKNMKPLFDRVIVVACAPSVQLARLITRDDLSLEDAELRLEAQMPIDEKAKLGDFLIRNDLDVPALEREVSTCIDSLLALAHHAQT